MKIAFNPSTVAALTSPPNNKDITFDLKGHNIFARGVEFKGTDTNTWRPVVDNLISDSTTSSLSAKQGKVLKALIDGKSNSGHTHDDRYLKLTGGVLTGNLTGTSATFSGRFHGGGDDEGIIIKPASNGYAGLTLGAHDGERSVFYFTKGNPFWRYNNGTNNLDIKHPKKAGTIALTSDIPTKSSWNYDDRYLRLSGGTMNSDALITFADSGSWGTGKGPLGARGGLRWTGQSDSIKLYAEETAADNLDLVIQFGDDNSNGLSVRNKTNTQTSYISASGVITTGTFKGNLDWSYITNKPATATRWPSWEEVTGKPSSFTPSTHTHGLSNSVFFLNMPSISGNAKWKEVFGYPVNYNLLLSVRINSPAPEWCAGNYSSGILYGGSDTKGFMSSAYNVPLIMWAGGNGSSDDSVPKWYIGIRGTHKSIYNLTTIASEANAAYNLRHSHANKSVLDGITSGLVSNWNTAYNFVSTISGSNTDKIINKWDEIVNFLAGIDSNNKLNTLLNSKLSVYGLADKTNVGTIKNNGIYYSTTDASSSTLTNSPFSNGFALINMTSYDGGDDLRRSRLAFNAYGEIKVSDDRSQLNTAETWYNVLTSKNSGISGSTIKLNGTSITVYSSGTADGRYVKKSGDTMTGILTIDYANFGALTIKRSDDSNGASIQFRGKSNIYGYIGFNAANRNKQLLRWNDAGSQVYTILDTSSTYTSSGKGVINGSEITQVSNATTAINSNRLRSNTEFALGNNFLQYFNTAGLESSGIKNAAPDKDWWHIIRMNHPNSKGYFSELAIALNSYNGVYWRTINAGKEARTWTRLANVSEIPSSLKNPNAIKFKDINGNVVTYDGSAAKDLTAGTYIAKLPYGFASFASGATWGNTTGTSFASWNDSTGGSIDFRRDNPSAGKMSIKVDGRVYVNEGRNPVLSAESNNGFWGMRTPDGGNGWIRTPNNGLIPYISGNAGSGHSSLGTSGWYFSTAYIDKIYGSLKGNADTASSAHKLTTARNIALGTDLRGSANFDGSGNITINANINACTVSVGSTDTLPFKRIAHFETGGSQNDNALLLYISEGYINGRSGICRVEFRTDNISSSSTSIMASAAVRWLVRYGYGLDSLYAGYYVTAGKAYIDIYLKTAGGYRGTVIRVLQDSRGGINSNVQLISARYNNENDHKEAYSSIEAAATALYNKAYTRIVSGSDVGTVNYANSTGSTTKLQTARKLWGQSFDGTKDISGSLSGTGNIAPGSAAAFDIGSNSLDYRYGYFRWIGAKSGQKLELGANNSGFGQGLCIDTNLNVGIGTNSPAYKLDVRGDTKITGSIRDLSIGGGIYWNPHVESATDGSDAASITVVKAGVAGGTTLVLSQQNDSNDTIQFKTSTAARLYHNSNQILTSGDTKVSSGKGYINNTEITQVNNASSANKLNKWFGSRVADLNQQFGDGALRIFNATSSTTANKCPSDASILHLAWDNNGGWDTQLALATGGEAMYFRGQFNSTWNPWRTILHSGNSSISGNTITINGSSLTVSKSDHNHNGKYLRLDGSDTMQGNLNLCSVGTSYIGKGSGDKSGADFTEANIVIRSWWGISFKSFDDKVRTYIDTRTGNIGTKGKFIGDLTGNSDTTTKWKTARAFTIGNTSKNVDGSNNVSWSLSEIGAASSGHNHDNKYLKWLGNAGQSNMNAIGRISHSSGMTALADPGNTTDNPMEGGSKSTSWHLYWQTNYTDDPSGSNAWVAQIVNRAGTDRWWVRSRSGGTITNGTGWASNWRFLVTAPTSGLGNGNQPIYINSAGEVVAANSYPTSLRSPHALTLKANGTTLATYDGSSAKEANFTYANVGAASANHTHTVFRNNLMIKGTDGISDSASIHLGIGDSDTGFKWISDGKCQIYANNVAIGEWTSGGMNWFRNPTVNGNKVWNAGNDGSGSGLDADLLDGWHKDNIQWTGYITSGNSLASYWFKMYDITVTSNQYNDITITFLVSEGYSAHFSIFYLKIRQNGTNNSGNYNLGVTLCELVGNLRDKVVAYYNNSTGNVQLWGNTGNQGNTMNYTVIKKTTRTATDSASLGTLIAQSFSSVQTPPSTGYTKATMSRVGSVSYSDSTGSVHWNNVTNKPSTFNPAAHTHTWTSITDKIVAGNEFNIVSAGFKESMWFNYLPINDRNKTAAVASYIMGNGAKGYASVQASGFIKHGSNSSYVLLGDGGHAAISQLSVKYATSAGSATSATKVIVNQHTSNDINYPLVWSNQSNTSSVTENQLYKSWADLYYNPKNKRLTVGGSVVSSSFVKSGGTNQQLLRADGGVAAFNWTGQSGQPTWLWGGNDFNSYYVYNPSNFRVAYAASAGNADTLDGEHAGNFVRAGAIEADGTDLNALDTYSFIKSVNSKVTGHSPKGNNGWYNIIQAVHRNGQADGPSYIGQIALGMTVNTDDMFFRGKRTDPWKTVIHSGNIGSQSVAYASKAGSIAWDNVTGKPTIPNPTDYYWANIKVSASSNTQTKPSVNTIYANNWFRSQGATGWYNESYGGGLHMTDTTWIRTFGNKSFYCNKQIYSSDSIRMGDIYLEHTNEINSASGLHLNYQNSGNVTLCKGGGAVIIGHTPDNIGNNKLYVNGPTTLNSVATFNGLVTNNGGILPASYDVNKNNTACYVWGDAMSTGVTAITDALDPRYVSVHHSQNNGSSWSDMGMTNQNKFSLYANNGSKESIYLGANNTTGGISQIQKNQLMVTFEIPDNLYSQLCWASIDINNGVQTVCTVEIIAKDGTIKNTFTKNLYGWNNLNYINFWGNNSAVVSIGQDSARFVRFKFKHDAGNTYVRNTLIHKIRIFSYTKHALDGGDFRSIMANTGHLYKYDANLNTTFPNAINCTTLNVGKFIINGSDINNTSPTGISFKQNGTTIMSYFSEAVNINKKLNAYDAVFAGRVSLFSIHPLGTESSTDTRSVLIGDIANYKFAFKRGTDGQLLFMKWGASISITSVGCTIFGKDKLHTPTTISGDGKSRIFIYQERTMAWYEFYCA